MSKLTQGQGSSPSFPRLLGDRLCLDFVNTIEAPLGRHPEEFLHEYSDLVRWAHHTRLITPKVVGALLEACRKDEIAAADVFARTLRLREALTRIFRAIAHGATPVRHDLDRSRDEYRLALRRVALLPSVNGFVWEDVGHPGDLDRPLWPVVQSAVETLTTADLRRIHECPGADDCGWLFYDTSRNGSRRWCSMEGCGSRMKMRHHYARSRSSTSTSTSDVVG